MSIDGLSHFYCVTRDEEVLALLYEMREVFDKIDKMEIKAQTNCCLTAARDFIRLYQETGDTQFLDSATKLWNLYVEKGMTYTYQNFNWWGKGDTWTEPCAVVDSLILAGELFKLNPRNVLTYGGKNIFMYIQTEIMFTLKAVKIVQTCQTYPRHAP